MLFFGGCRSPLHERLGRQLSGHVARVHGEAISDGLALAVLDVEAAVSRDLGESLVHEFAQRFERRIDRAALEFG